MWKQYPQTTRTKTPKPKAIAKAIAMAIAKAKPPKYPIAKAIAICTLIFRGGLGGKTCSDP